MSFEPHASSDSDARLREHALAYLSRFPTTKVKLRKVLLRWAQRRGLQISELLLAELMSALQEGGYLDDEKFAIARARSLLQRGASLLDIRTRLAKDGIAAEQIRQTLETLMAHEDKEEVELLAALRVAQKKKMGPFSAALPVAQELREKRRRKDISALARRGFGWGIVKKIMEASDEDLLEWQKKMYEQSR